MYDYSILLQTIIWLFEINSCLVSGVGQCTPCCSKVFFLHQHLTFFSFVVTLQPLLKKSPAFALATADKRGYSSAG